MIGGKIKREGEVESVEEGVDGCGFGRCTDAVGDELCGVVPVVEGEEGVESFSAEGEFRLGDFDVSSWSGEFGDLVESVEAEGSVDGDHFGGSLSGGRGRLEGGMLWAQASVCLILWVGFGIWASRRAMGMNLAKKPWAGILMMVGGAAVMFGGLAMMAMNGGIQNGKLTGLGWAGVGVLGMIFTGAQSYGAVWVLRSVVGEETTRGAGASESRD